MAVDIFLNILKTGAAVRGESLDALCAGMIQLHSFRMGSFTAVGGDLAEATGRQKKAASSSVSPPTPKGEGVDTLSFSVTKLLDTATPDLLLNYFQTATAKPVPFASANLYLRYPLPNPTSLAATTFLQIQYWNLFVCHYSMIYDFEEDESTRPVETVQFSFEKYLMTYTPQTSTEGAVAALPRPLGWDFVNKVVV
jgi:type VI protein secretion system component Hcp